ncbi:MAG: mannitol-phosphate 5-dehydrogenase, partial [Verrucomicrobiota bacterium]|nr:mannitol-phosphate 5-dehydrogenase [Verrucomicrobiota bacterium]
MNRTYTGFGFGAIQSGLLLYEAFRSGNFSRLVVAEVIPEVIAAVREANGYFLNIATENGIEHHFIEGIEIYNPAVPAEAEQLVAALAESQEIGTALPSIDFFTRGSPAVADLLRKAFTAKLNDPALPDAVVYTA